MVTFAQAQVYFQPRRPLSHQDRNGDFTADQASYVMADIGETMGKPRGNQGETRGETIGLWLVGD